MARKLLCRDGQVSGKLYSSFFFFYTYISNGRSLAPPLGRKMKLILSLSVFWKLWSCGEKRSFHHFRPNDAHYCHLGLISRAGFPLRTLVSVASAMLLASRGGVPNYTPFSPRSSIFFNT
jgi:hypothetical protein